MNEEHSMTEVIEMVRTGQGMFPRQISCSKSEYRDALRALVEPQLAGRRLGPLARRAGTFAFAEVEAVAALHVPDDRRLLIAEAISGTADLGIYELVLRLIDHPGLGTSKFAKSFVSNPDPIAAPRILDALVDGYADGRIRGVERLLLSWLESGVLTEEQESSIANVLLQKAEITAEWCSRIARLPDERSEPWLRTAAYSDNVEAATYAIRTMHSRGITVEDDLLEKLLQNPASAAELMSNGDATEHFLKLNPDLALASTLAKNGMIWKFLCETCLMWTWTLDDSLEIEQIGTIDGVGVETDGVIFVYKYRLLDDEDYCDWMMGVSGPYSVGEEPARHLGGLDYTYAGISPIKTTMAAEVEKMLGVSMMFSSLAAKPKTSD